MSKAEIELGGIRIGTSTLSNTESFADHTSSANIAFHALVLGCFSGNSKPSSRLKVINVDRDTFDDVMASICPTLTLNTQSLANIQSTENDVNSVNAEDPDQSITLSFNELEDFEPDALYESLEIFSDLRTLRRRLSNNATFEAAAKEINAWSEVNSKNKTNPAHIEQTRNADQKTPETEIAEGGSFLDSLLSETEHRQEEAKVHAGESLAQSFIQQIVAPYIIPAAHPKQSELVSNIDDSISGLMNLILHHPDFQALESSWRSLYRSIRSINTNANLKIYIADISKDVLFAKLENEDITRTDVFKSLIEPYTSISGCTPWSLIIGDYYFGDAENDLLLLEKLGLLAQLNNATFVSAAKPELVNCDDLGKTPDADDWNSQRDENYLNGWAKLRSLPQAANLALTFPRILNRLPYGKNTKSIDSFTYEEMHGSVHNDYLWGNSAYGILILIAGSYEQNKWQFSPRNNNQLNNLPAHAYEEDGETDLKPCAEVYLTEKGGEIILKNGLLPVWSILRSDSVKIGPFLSLHESNQHIQGRWQS